MRPLGVLLLLACTPAEATAPQYVPADPPVLVYETVAAGVTWRTTGGTVTPTSDSTAVYTPPTTPGTYLIIGTVPGGAADTSIATVLAPVVVDSWMVRPDKVVLSPGQQQQFCNFIGFRGGHIGLRRNAEAGVPFCDSVYKSLPAAVRAVTPAEQAVADTVCVFWKAEGGAITAEPCAGVPS